MKARALTPDEQQDLSDWRLVALSIMPYMASMLLRSPVLSAPGLGTMAVDKHHRLYIDFDHARAQGVQWCAEVLLHEMGHLLGRHAELADDVGVTRATHDVWNVAADASINDDLAAAGCEQIAETGVLPSSFGEEDGKTAMYYFRTLLDKLPQPDPQDEAGGRGGDGEDGSGEGSQEPQEPFRGCGSGGGGKAAPVELEGDTVEGVAEGVNEGEAAQIMLSTLAAMEEHEKSNGRGSVPAGMMLSVRESLAPAKTPWQRILYSRLAPVFKGASGSTHVAHHKRDRRRNNVTIGGRRVIFPGRMTRKPKIVAVRDTSGSMLGGRIEAVSSQILAISRRVGLRGQGLLVMDVDAESHSLRPFTSPRDLTTAHGGGGTDMRVAIEAAAQVKGVSGVVVLTDGYTPWPDLPVGVPVIACVIDGSVSGVPDWIRVVEVDADGG